MNTSLAADAKVYRLDAASTVSAGNGTISAWSTVTSTDGHLTGSAPSNLFEITTIRGDLTLATEHDTQKVNLKGRRTKATVQTLEDGSTEFDILHDPTDYHWQSLFAANHGRTNVPLLFLSGDKAVAGSEGIYAYFAVTDFSRPEKLDDVLVNHVKVEYGLADVEPQRVIVGS